MDHLWGHATEVVDGDTFIMEVTHVGRRNDYEYNDEERVRIEGIDAPELPSRSARRSQRQLARCLDGERLHVFVHARDRYGRIIGTVEVA